MDRKKPANTGRALLIVHQKTSRVGRVGRILRRRGYTLEIRCPNLGHELPPSPDSYDLVTIFGGPMSVNDAERMPGIAAELDFIPRVLEARTPLLAICLGAQLLARVLGSEIRPHPEGLSQIGYAPIYPTPAGARYFDGPLTVYHWNSEGFELPPDTVLLARADRFPNQAFRYGKRAYGLQFHADVTPAMVDRWTRRAADHLERPGAQSRAAQLAVVTRYNSAISRWFSGFMARMLGGQDSTTAS